jgi:hydroxymethylpyrimidine/phosphomethylpyrimidine kinase
MRVALSIAGSDPSGGAGIQADLKTFHQFGVYGEAALTLLTVQNTVGVERVEFLDPGFVVAQIRAVVSDIPPAAAKTGALGNVALVEAVAAEAAGFGCPLGVDPVMISKHGVPLLAVEARKAMEVCLLPHAALVTPNLHEASAMVGREITTVEGMREAARRIHGMGARGVLVKGGHLESEATDVLFDGVTFREFAGERFDTKHTHGTGCSYSAAITALLARGVALADAVAGAKGWIAEAIRTNPGLGRGSGPVNHHAKVF